MLDDIDRIDIITDINEILRILLRCLLICLLLCLFLMCIRNYLVTYQITKMLANIFEHVPNEPTLLANTFMHHQHVEMRNRHNPRQRFSLPNIN